MKNDKWIQPTIDLKKIGTDPNKIVSVQNSGVLETDFYRYANNFHEAADIILRELIGPDSEANIAKLDTWYFALIYLYRQSLELMLKANIFKLIQDEQDRKDAIAEVRHDVGAAFDKIITLQGIDINSNQNIKWLSDFLHDISKIDRESDMFRYPFGNNLSVLFNNQTHINLVATYYNMTKCFDLLSEYYQTQQFNNKQYHCYDPKLNVEGGNYYMQSVVGYKYHERSFYPYYTSYEECASFLAELIQKENKPHLFMPMCYLFRNGVELGLKRIIVEDSHLGSEKALRVLKRKKHSIQGLWNSISDELQQHVPNQNDPTLTYVEQYISSFHNTDITSDLFRYPCNKELKVYYQDETKLDIDNVSSSFQELLNFLDGVSAMMAQVKEYEAEAAAEAASWSI